MKQWIPGAALALGLCLFTGRQAAAQQRVKQNAPAVRAPQAHEVEGYSGKLLANDVSFALHLNSDHTATADWVASPEKTSHLKGAYTGDDGVYVVTLKQESGGNPLGAQGLTLYLKRMGGMEPGQFTTESSHAKREIAGLQLSSIEGYKTKPGKIGQRASARSSNQRRGTLGTNRRRNTSRRAGIPRLPRLP